jgi:signal transduction histidine kinase
MAPQLSVREAVSHAEHQERASRPCRGSEGPSGASSKACTAGGAGMNARYLLVVILVAMTASAVLVLLAWLRSGRGSAARPQPERVSELRWWIALLAVAGYAMILLSGPFARNERGPELAILPLAAGCVILLRPRWVRGTVAVALVLLGLYAFAMARDYYGAAMMLPQAYLLLALGGLLSWRAVRHSPWLARPMDSWLSQLRKRGVSLWCLALFPVAFAIAALMTPNQWLTVTRPGIAWTIIVLAGATLVVARLPRLAGIAATAGLVFLALAGFYLTWRWIQGGVYFASNRYGSAQYGVIDVVSASNPSPFFTLVQAVAFLGAGVLLVPRTIPQARGLFGWAYDPDLLKRVQRLTESRAVAVDTAAADLRRLERDLHDGAQARLVALGMSLRAAERLIPTSPDAAVALVAEAREASAKALTELRELVRGVHPPVLADRGLADALRALALDSPLNVQTDLDLPGRLPAPVETACYFAVAEVLTNAAKHSGAREARICASHSSGLLRIEVTDFGLGGADAGRGSGLVGVEKRLASFDGILAISSPAGGPTIVVMEVPCALSSPRTSSC